MSAPDVPEETRAQLRRLGEMIAALRDSPGVGDSMPLRRAVTRMDELYTQLRWELPWLDDRAGD